MAKNLRLAEAAVNAQANTFARLLDFGQVAVVDAAGRELAVFALSGRAFADAVGGQVATAPVADADVTAAGRAGEFVARNYRGDEVARGTVGVGDDFDLRLPAVDLAPGMVLEWTGWTHRVPAQQD